MYPTAAVEEEEPHGEPEGDPAGPQVRSNHSTCQMGGKRVLLFGGESGGELLNDFAMVDMAAHSLKWFQPMVKGIKVHPRKGAQMASAGNHLFLFSGVGKDDEEAEYLIDEMLVFTYDPVSHILKYTPTTFHGPTPPLRQQGMFTTYKPNHLVRRRDSIRPCILC